MSVPASGVLQIMAVMGVTQDTAQALWQGFLAARSLFDVLTIEGVPVPWRGRVVKTATLNVRRGPGTTTDVVGKLALGALVQVYGVYGDWYVIDLPCGYVSKSYVEAEK